MFQRARPNSDRLRTWVSFGSSGSFHATLLLWLAVAAAHLPREAPPSLYDQMIGPGEARLVWYNLHEKLPDIKPSPAAPGHTGAERPRARRKFSQALVSGPKDDARTPQTIVTEAPPAELPKPLPLPNVVAGQAAPPPRARLFLPPPEKAPDPPIEEAPPPELPDSPPTADKPAVPVPQLSVSPPRPRPKEFQPPPDRKPATNAATPPPALPDAPRATAKPAVPVPQLATSAASRPQPKEFQPPPDRKAAANAATPPPALPDAPRATAKPAVPVPQLAASAAPRPQPKEFQPPPDRKPATNAATPPPALPDAPRTAAKPAAPVPQLATSAVSRPQPREFQPPPDRKPAANATPPPALPDAPRTAAKPSAPVPQLAGTPPRPQPLPFHPPPNDPAPQSSAPSLDTPAPPVTSPSAAGAQSFAIASLQPSKFTAVPVPPASHEAGFSGAPKLHPESTGAPSNDSAALVVPNLSAGGGARDPLPTLAPAPEVSARGRLLAELRTPLDPHSPASPTLPPGALRVSSAPDPRLQGRVIYAMAIQMPNITSYSGSWMVWFAERVPQPGASPAKVRPPEPRHKVDPAYIRSAADQRIEGVIKLAAVIGRDGRVDHIELLSGIDNRLDSSAVEALGKWVFEPALRDGVPIEVDAVFEVPFHLAPKPTR